LRWYQASITFSAREMARRRSPETIPLRGFGVCTVQTHWSRPGAILTAYSMCRCSISSPEGCSWEPVALCKYRPSAPLWRRSVHNCSSFPDRAIVVGARHATYDTRQPIGWIIGGDPNPGASSHVALCADVAPSGDNHFDCCDLFHHRIIHDSARKDLAGCASPSDGPDAGEIGPGWDPPKCPDHQAWVGALEQTSWVCRHAALRELMCAGHPRDATPNGSDLRSIRRRSEAQGVNVLRSKTKVRKLFIIERAEPRPDALLPGIVVSLNESTHQARSGFQVLGGARGHASPQKLKVHDRLLFFLQRETEARTRAGGQMSWACGVLCRYGHALFQRPLLDQMRTHLRGGARRPMSCKARAHV
jgi:hypothetical protein